MSRSSSEGWQLISPSEKFRLCSVVHGNACVFVFLARLTQLFCLFRDDIVQSWSQLVLLHPTVLPVAFICLFMESLWFCQEALYRKHTKAETSTFSCNVLFFVFSLFAIWWVWNDLMIMKMSGLCDTACVQCLNQYSGTNFVASAPLNSVLHIVNHLDLLTFLSNWFSLKVFIFAASTGLRWLVSFRTSCDHEKCGFLRGSSMLH